MYIHNILNIDIVLCQYILQCNTLQCGPCYRDVSLPPSLLPYPSLPPSPHPHHHTSH